MKSVRLIATVLCSLCGDVLAQGQPVVQPPRDVEADALKKIDRAIKKEPAYKAPPKYCLVVFGAEAKFRVWLVIDGDALYADLNGNGDLTEKGERFKLDVDKGGYSEPFKIGDLSDLTTKITHKDFGLCLYGKAGCRLGADAGFDNPKIPRLYGYALVTFANKPVDAPIVHFGGPLTMGVSVATLEDRPAFVCAEIGTPGVGKGSFADYSKSVFHHVDAKFQPDLELETPGEKNAVVREKAKFYRDSIEGVYLYPVQPGAPGDRRQTKMTLSFPDWADGKVVPRSFSEPSMTLKKK